MHLLCTHKQCMSKIKISFLKNPNKDIDLNIVSSVHAFVFKDGKILVLNGSRGWDIPGGHVESGEDVYGALVREIKEETGLDIPEDLPINFIASAKVEDNEIYRDKMMLFAIIRINKSCKVGKWLEVDEFLERYSQEQFKEAISSLLKKARDYE